jgi:hypothetical protein
MSEPLFAVDPFMFEPLFMLEPSFIFLPWSIDEPLFMLAPLFMSEPLLFVPLFMGPLVLVWASTGPAISSVAATAAKTGFIMEIILSRGMECVIGRVPQPVSHPLKTGP